MARVLHAVRYAASGQASQAVERERGPGAAAGQPLAPEVVARGDAHTAVQVEALFDDGHPASSKLDLFEALVDRIHTELRERPELFEETAFLIACDEGGGYWDSGAFAPLDFFGDGPRIPFLVVSPRARGGKIAHSYADQASVLKFIERNWRLEPLTSRSRDNLPNPKHDASNPYIPTNLPAIGDLFDMFDFDADTDR